MFYENVNRDIHKGSLFAKENKVSSDTWRLGDSLWSEEGTNSVIAKVVPSLTSNTRMPNSSILPSEINQTENLKGCANSKVSQEICQIINRPAVQYEDNNMDYSKDKLQESITQGWSSSSKKGVSLKQPNLVRLREDLEIPAFHGCDFSVLVDSRVPEGTMICEALNHTDVGLCTARSIVTIHNPQTDKNRYICPRTEYYTNTPDYKKKHSPSKYSKSESIL